MQALTMGNACEHIARVQEAKKRYHIHDSRRIFNVDETGISFNSICSCSLQKCIGRATNTLYHVEVSIKRNLERVALMGVLNAASVS